MSKMSLSEAAISSRRSFVTGAAALAASLRLQLAARAAGFAPDAEVCRLQAEQEVGPYYIPKELLRANIREGKAGVPLTLRLAVIDAASCRPLTGVAVDVWHCDAIGLYSGFTKQNPRGPGGPDGPPPPGFDPQHPGTKPGPPEGQGPPPENHPTDKLTFLRGIQMAGTHGTVEFQTVFPGFYMGRTNHIHFKVRTGGHAAGRTYDGGHVSHVGQVFFPEEVAVELMRHPPYSTHHIHRTTQSEDDIFTGQHGDLNIATLRPRGTDYGHGMTAELVAAVDLSAVPAPVGMHGPGEPPSRRQIR